MTSLALAADPPTTQPHSHEYEYTARLAHVLRLLGEFEESPSDSLRAQLERQRLLAELPSLYAGSYPAIRTALRIVPHTDDAFDNDAERITVQDLADGIRQTEGATRRLLEGGHIPGARRITPGKKGSPWIIPASAPAAYIALHNRKEK